MTQTAAATRATRAQLERKIVELQQRLDEAINLTEQQAAEIARLADWRDSVSKAVQTIPEFQTGEWNGDKAGWGWHFEMVRYCQRQREQAEAERDAARSRLAQVEAGAQEMAQEYHALLSEPMYAGTRADWMHRAQRAEGKIAHEIEICMCNVGEPEIATAPCRRCIRLSEEPTDAH